MISNFMLRLFTFITLTLGICLGSRSQANDAQIAPVNIGSPLPSPTPSASSDAPSKADKIQFRKQTIRIMKAELEQTASAVQSSNYDTARSKFRSALKKWYLFGGTIKRLLPETYQKVATDFNIVNSTIASSHPSHQSLIANLQNLINEVDVAVKISDDND